MKLNGTALAFDSASEMLALAIGTFKDTGLSVCATGDAEAPRTANQVLVSRAEDILAEAGIEASDLSFLVVGRGPGSFTGVRIGVATAKGMSCGLGIPVYGVSTLDAVAWHAWRGGIRGRLGVIEDAMRKEVYPVRFLLDETGIKRLDIDSVAKPKEVAAKWLELGEPLTLVGNGLKKHASCFEDGIFTLAPEELWAPDGEGLLQACAADAEGGWLGSGDPMTLLPVYTRLSDAEENERKRLDEQTEAVPASGVADEKSSGGLFLHPLSINDVAGVVALQERALPDAVWDAQDLADEVGHDNRTWWVARLDGAIVGCVGGSIKGDTLVIESACVEEEMRQRGIGTRLIERVAADGRALGAESVICHVGPSQADMMSVCAKLGLERVSEEEETDTVLLRGVLPLAAIKHSLSLATPGVSSRENKRAIQEASDPLILAIESSCDETAAAVIDGNRRVLADEIASQIDFHARFGGVVPEIASRKHIEAIVPTVMDTMARAHVNFSDLSAIAVTQGPGLVGALVVGVAFAKGLAFATGLPLVCVNHLEGHLYANRFIDPTIEPPFVALLVSGGNTMLVHVKNWGNYEVLGSTLDDAVGEAFDKVAKALGLGYPGGPILSRYAKEGNPRAIRFPRAMLHSGDFSFSLSGLKTAVITYINEQNRKGIPVNIPDLAASFTAAVVDVQVAKALEACKKTGTSLLAVGGGVAANPDLRQALVNKLGRKGIRVIVPDLRACTDNAAMIGSVALDLYNEGVFGSLDADPIARMPLRHE